MAEHYTRCRFRLCMIHIGDKPPVFFSQANKEEMMELYMEGWRQKEIAEAFGSKEVSVYKIIKRMKVAAMKDNVQ